MNCEHKEKKYTNRLYYIEEICANCNIHLSNLAIDICEECGSEDDVEEIKYVNDKMVSKIAVVCKECKEELLR